MRRQAATAPAGTAAASGRGDPSRCVPGWTSDSRFFFQRRLLQDLLSV